MDGKFQDGFFKQAKSRMAIRKMLEKIRNNESVKLKGFSMRGQSKTKVGRGLLK